jgi:hypothetical protein
VLSLWVISAGAGDEPYVRFRSYDVYVQVGVAIALIALWFQFAAWLIYAAITRRIHRGWLALLVWIVGVLLYLWQSPTGYVYDISRYVAQRN